MVHSPEKQEKAPVHYDLLDTIRDETKTRFLTIGNAAQVTYLQSVILSLWFNFGTSEKTY